MDLQQLIDMPGHGQANKVVKAMGNWLETTNDSERIDWLEENAVNLMPDSFGIRFIVKPTNDEVAYDVIREDIDMASTQHTAIIYRNHLRAYE